MHAPTLVRCVIASVIILAAPSVADDDTLSRTRSHNEEQLDRLEQQMNVGPRSAMALGWRTNWRQLMPVRPVSVHVEKDAVFILNERNELSMLDSETGTLKWRTYAANATDRILDVVHLPDLDTVLILRSESILTVSDRTGMPESVGASSSAVQPLEWLATDGGFIHGSTYIYGGLGGEVVWQGFRYGFAARAHRIGRRIDTTLVQCGDTVVAAARSGEVAGLDLNTGRLSWKVTLLDRVAGTPAATDDLVVIAGRDQHVRALNPLNGRPLWTALLEHPLHAGPTLMGDFVYQQVPEQGLYCWEARPSNSPDGVQAWSASDVTGSVISRSGSLLLSWDQDRRMLQAVSDATGSIESSKHVPNATLVSANDKVLIVVGADGRVECLVPRTETLGTP